MAFSLAHLLIHSSAVPGEARAALQAARSAPPGDRLAHLASAARVLYRDTDVNCDEARELVGLTTCEAM